MSGIQGGQGLVTLTIGGDLAIYFHIHDKPCAAGAHRVREWLFTENSRLQGAIHASPSEA
jgi:hypothetical protein